MASPRVVVRRIRLVCASLFVLGLVIALLVKLLGSAFKGDLARTGQIASILSMVLTLTAFLLTWAPQAAVALRRQVNDRSNEDMQSKLRAPLAHLAEIVKTQWEVEERLRRVSDPFPLQVGYEGVLPPLSDRLDRVYSAPETSEIELRGAVANIVDVFARIPSGRLVVLGKRGAGKSILASRFVRSTLSAWRSADDGPVPFLLSASSWNPTKQTVHQWLAEQLILTAPNLVFKDSSGRTQADLLIGNGWILPVIDGFDEIEVALRKTAIQALNGSLRECDKLFITSRYEEYDRARTLAGAVISRSVAVKLLDLELPDLVNYLPATVNGGMDDSSRAEAWRRVIAKLRTSYDSPSVRALNSVLRTPLMVSLARTIYSESRDADPMHLLNGQPEGSVLEREGWLSSHLLGGLVPAVYPSQREVLTPLVEGDFRWTREDAVRWLSFLARQLSSGKKSVEVDIKWWELILAVPRLAVGVITAAVLEVGFGSVIACIGWLGHWADSEQRVAFLISGLVATLIVASCSGFALSRGASRRPTPSRMQIQLRGSVSRIGADLSRLFRTKRLWVWLGGWLAVTNLVVVPLGTGVKSILLGSVGAIAVGVGTSLTGSIASATLGIPLSTTKALSPHDLLREDSNTARLQSIWFGVIGAGVVWSIAWTLFYPISGAALNVILENYPILIISVILTAMTGALGWALMYTLWGPWILARVWLAATRKLPWNIMDFLRDAHQKRALLRQLGAVYQFRHLELQMHLANE